jgi:hypothetical protein
MRVDIGFMSAKDAQKTSICEFRRRINRTNVLDAESNWKPKISESRSSEEACRRRK